MTPDFDPSAWTSEDVPSRGFYWVRSRDGVDRVQEFFAGDIHPARFVHPIPSAAELAARSDVCEAAKAVSTATDVSEVKLALKVLDAALSRLEASRG